MAKQPGLFRAGGGSNGNAAFLREGRQCKGRYKHWQYGTTKQMYHVNSPCWDQNSSPHQFAAQKSARRG
jgi:hypothetical protein